MTSASIQNTGQSLAAAIDNWKTLEECIEWHGDNVGSDDEDFPTEIGCCYAVNIKLHDHSDSVALSKMVNKIVYLYTTASPEELAKLKDKPIRTHYYYKRLIENGDKAIEEHASSSCLQRVWAAICKAIQSFIECFTGNWRTEIDKLNRASQPTTVNPSTPSSSVSGPNAPAKSATSPLPVNPTKYLEFPRFNGKEPTKAVKEYADRNCHGYSAVLPIGTFETLNGAMQSWASAYFVKEDDWHFEQFLKAQGSECRLLKFDKLLEILTESYHSGKTRSLYERWTQFEIAYREIYVPENQVEKLKKALASCFEDHYRLVYVTVNAENNTRTIEIGLDTLFQEGGYAPGEQIPQLPDYVVYRLISIMNQKLGKSMPTTLRFKQTPESGKSYPIELLHSLFASENMRQFLTTHPLISPTTIDLSSFNITEMEYRKSNVPGDLREIRGQLSKLDVLGVK